MQDAPKQSEAFHTFLRQFSQIQNRILLHIVLLKCPHVQNAFLKFTSCDNHALVGVYSNYCCSCSFEPEIIEIGQWSHNMYSNKILNFQESTTILNACTKKVWKLIEVTTYLHFVCSYFKRIFSFPYRIWTLFKHYDSNTHVQRGAGNKDNKSVPPHFLNLQNCLLFIGCSLMS